METLHQRAISKDRLYFSFNFILFPTAPTEFMTRQLKVS